MPDALDILQLEGKEQMHRSLHCMQASCTLYLRFFFCIGDMCV